MEVTVINSCLSQYPELRDVFYNLSPDEFNLLELMELPPDGVLISENSFGSLDLFFILSGVCVGERINFQRDCFFASYKVQRHEFIGLQELISPTPIKRDITIRAKTPIMVLKIPGKEFMRWQSCHIDICNTITHRVLSLQFQIRDLLINCVLNDLKSAGIYYLCYLYRIYLYSCYPTNYTGAVKLWDTRQEIGTTLARDVRSVERVISSLRADGYLTVTKGKLHIDSTQYKRLNELLNNH